MKKITETNCDKKEGICEHYIPHYIKREGGFRSVSYTHLDVYKRQYSTCVGEGPFKAEYFGDKAEKLRKLGGEYGAATGRPRRVGPFDVVASRYGIRCQGAKEIALTKLDVLSGYEEIEICTEYLLDGKAVEVFPFTDVLDECKPVFKTVKGWNKDISKCRKKEDLPQEALDLSLIHI